MVKPASLEKVIEAIESELEPETCVFTDKIYGMAVLGLFKTKVNELMHPVGTPFSILIFIKRLELEEKG